jgi:hypothetical protein
MVSVVPRQKKDVTKGHASNYVPTDPSPRHTDRDQTRLTGASVMERIKE